MIFQLLFTIIFVVITLLFSWLPDATTLPWGLDDMMITAVSYFKSFAVVFPVVSIVLEAFLVLIGFKIAMKIIKLFIGHRAPIE